MSLVDDDILTRELSLIKGYRFQHSWELKAPLETLWGLVSQPANWSSIFYGLSVQQNSGELPSLSEKSQYSFQIKGDLPYTLSFKVKILKLLQEELLFVRIDGDLKGVGKFELYRKGSATIINFKMNVVPAKWWMRLLAPIARKIFIKNHNLVVDKSYHSLSNRLAMEPG